MISKKLIKYALSVAPGYLLKQGTKLLSRQFRAQFKLFNGYNETSFFTTETSAEVSLAPIINNLCFSEKDKMKYPFNEHAKKILQHYFDILGSGETKVFYGMSCKGFLGYSYNNTTHPSNKNELIMKLNSGNRDKASKIRNLISKNYIPIDWHLDFKSGFRWK